MVSVGDLKVLVTGLGYDYAGTCNCNGFHTEKYKRENYLLYIRTRSGKAMLKKYGVTVIPFNYVEQFFKEFQKEENLLQIAG